jgi:hypothetical protein
LAFTPEPPITHKVNSRKDESLLVRWDTFLILYAGLEIVNGIRSRTIYHHSLPGESLYNDWPSKIKHKIPEIEVVAESNIPTKSLVISLTALRYRRSMAGSGLSVELPGPE